MSEEIIEIEAGVRKFSKLLGNDHAKVHPELYDAVMYMPGFSDEALFVAFAHLVDNKAQGTAFVKMSEAHRLLWLRKFSELMFKDEAMNQYTTTVPEADKKRKKAMLDEEDTTIMCNMINAVNNISAAIHETAQEDVQLEAGKKRKRDMPNEEDTTAMCTITDAVNNICATIREAAAAIRETVQEEEVHSDLYGAVMYMPGFTDEALIVALSHLVDNKAQAIAFVKMTEAHCVLWLRTFLAKHYYVN